MSIYDFTVKARDGSELSLADHKGKVLMAEEEFSCRGAFMMLHKGRPNESDQRAAADFARKIVSQGE